MRHPMKGRHAEAVTILTRAGRARLENRLAVATAELERLDAATTQPIDAVEVRETRGRLLVHPIEIAAEPGYVSVDAPLGRALLGRRVGERVVVRAPGGAYELEILVRRRSS